MNLNNVYLPHFCRPCYHKRNLMDLIMLLIGHLVLIITCVNGFVIRNSLNSSDAQSLVNYNHHSEFMPIKSATYELTVLHDQSADNQSEVKSVQKDQISKVNQLDLMDKQSQEQINQLNEVKYLNQLNKVNISPMSPIVLPDQQQQNLQSLKSQLNLSNDKERFDGQQSEQSTKQNTEVRDGFVVLTSAHNSKYPAPMFSRNVFAQAGNPITNDFFQQYHTSTTTVTIRPIVKEYHDDVKNGGKINEKINENFSEKTGVKTYSSKLNGSDFLNGDTFSPEDKPDEEKEPPDEHKELVSEFVDNLKNVNKDDVDGDGKSFYELFGNGITSYNLQKNSSALDSNKPVSDVNSNAPVTFFGSTTIDTNLFANSTSTPFFDLTAEDSNYRPSINHEIDGGARLKAHGTRPNGPLTTYELFKEYPLINNSNIIINQFHSTPNWTRPETSTMTSRNQTKIFAINPITKRPIIHFPTELSFLRPILANYSSFDASSYNRPVVITEFANDFLTNLSSDATSFNDLDNSDSNSRLTFFNFSSSTTTQSPIGSLDRNLVDVPLSSQWGSLANQLTSTTLSPLPPIHVSASDLITLRRNHSASKFPYKHNHFITTSNPKFRNNTLHLISSSTDIPHHFHALRLPASVTPPSVLYSATQSSTSSSATTTGAHNNQLNNVPILIPSTSSTTTTTSTITPNVYQYINVRPATTRQPPLANISDHNFLTLTNNHNFDESIHYNNPLRLATNPKLIQPLTLLVMSYLASKSSIGANLITRNDQPANSTAASNGGLVDWLRFSGRRNRKRNKSSSRSNKQISRQQKQRNSNSNNKSIVNSLPLAALSNLQLRPITLEDILISNQLAGASSLLQQTSFPASITSPIFYPSTKSPSASTSRVPQMIFETKRHRPSSNYIPDEFLNENGYTADDYEDEIRALFENPLLDPRLNNKLLNGDIAQQSLNKNTGSSTYRTHRNSHSSLNSRNSRTPSSQPPDSSGSSGSNVNSPTSHPLIDNELSGGHSTNTPAPRCDRFTKHICVDDFEYPETAILEEIDRKRNLFQLLYSEVKGEVPQVDGLSRLQEQALSWDNQFGVNNYLNDSSNESTFSSSSNSPNRNSYITMDDDLSNNDKTSYRFSSLIKGSNSNLKASGFICSSEILYGRPKLAKNVKGQWKVIVNAGQYTQTVRMEKCLQPNRSCSFVQSAIGATSRCAQVNAFHRLMVFEKGKGFYIDTFRIPSSCSCYVHKDKSGSSAGGGSSSGEFDSEEIGSNYYKKLNRKRTDSQPTIRDKSEIDRQTSNNRLQNQGISLPTSIFNQPFILNELNNLQRNKLQTLFPAFGQRVSTLSNANTLVNTKLQQPAVELRPLYLKNGGTLLASLLPLVGTNNDKSNGNLNATSLIEKLSISGTLNPAMLEQQQRELNQLILDLIKLNTNTPKTLADRSKIINLEDLIRSQLSLAQITPGNLFEQLNSAIFNLNDLNSKYSNRRKNVSKSDLFNTLTSLSAANKLNNNQKIGLLYLDAGTNDKKNKLNALPVVKLVQMPQLNNNQIIYGQPFVDKRKSDIAQLLMANKANYSNLLNTNFLNNNLLLNNKNSLIVPRDAINLATPISALKIITPDNLVTQPPQSTTESAKDSAEKEKNKDEESDEDDDEEKIVDDIDVGNLLGNIEDQEDKEDGEANYAEMNAESNHGESSEDHNVSKNEQHHPTNDQSPNEHPTNELNDDDKENVSNEPNDHERPNDLDHLDDSAKDSSNHLESNSSLFTFDNVLSNGPRRKLKPNIIQNMNQLKPNNGSFVSENTQSEELNESSDNVPSNPQPPPTTSSIETINTIEQSHPTSAFVTPALQRQKSVDKLKRGNWTTANHFQNRPLTVTSATCTFPSVSLRHQTALNGGHTLASHYSTVGINLLHTTLTNISQNRGQRISAKNMKCWTAAKSRSFYARDNVANFLKWCRTLGVREAVLFETEDLVSQRCAKNVVLCLLEVARIACSLLQFSPCPGLVQLEHEIDLIEQQEQQEVNINAATDYQSNNKQFGDEMQQLFDQLDVHPIDRDTTDASNSSVYHLNQDIRKAEICLVNSELDNQMSNNLIDLNEKEKNHLNSNDPSMHSSGDELSSCDLQSYVRTGDLNNLQMSRSYSSISAGSTTESKYSENSQVVVSQLDQKVMSIAKNFYGKKAKTGIQRIAEGKYKVAGKIVFIRLLKNKHVMVRVGGGWETLNHFLERHGSDLPPQHQISAADLLPMDTRPAQCTSRKKLQNTLFAVNTQQLCNYASQTSGQDSNSEQILFKQHLNLGSKSNNEICNNRENQLNYNLSGTSGLRRCLSSTPVLSSPEPVSSSGYCSSTASNSNTAISNQSILNEHKLLTTEDKHHQMSEKRVDHKAKYTIDGYQSSNTSLNSCDRVLIKSVSSNEMTKQDSIKSTIVKDAKKEFDEKEGQTVKHSTPGYLLRRPKSSSDKSDRILIEKSLIPIKLQQTSVVTQQTKTTNKYRTPIDSKICRNAFGFIQTPILNNKIQAIEQTKQINKMNYTSGQHLNTLSKRNLTISLSSLPIKTPTMLPVPTSKQTTSLRKGLIGNLMNRGDTLKMSQTRSNSTQNVNVQSSNFGFHSNNNKTKQLKDLNNRSKQYNSSTSLNSVPVCRSKNMKFNSIKTRSTNNLDHISPDAIRNRYPNYLTSSQRITANTNQTSSSSDLDNNTSSRYSSGESSPASKLRRPSLRAF